MFGIGSTELLLILVVALIVLGPKSLAKTARSLGKAMGEFRRVSTDFQRALNVEAAQEELREAEKKKASLKNASPQTPTNPEPESQKSASSLPEDSPLAQALARVREQAEKGETDSSGSGKTTNA